MKPNSGGEWSSSRPGQFSPGKNPGTHWIRGCVGPRACLDGLETTVIFCPCRYSTSQRGHYTDWAIPGCVSFRYKQVGGLSGWTWPKRRSQLYVACELACAAVPVHGSRGRAPLIPVLCTKCRRVANLPGRFTFGEGWRTFFWSRVPKFSINFEEIFSHPHGSFEEHNKVLQSSKNYNLLLHYYYYYLINAQCN
jgi:hypothetical protein